jgi:hypothetical protein
MYPHLLDTRSTFLTQVLSSAYSWSDSIDTSGIVPRLGHRRVKRECGLDREGPEPLIPVSVGRRKMSERYMEVDDAGSLPGTEGNP